jgi:hypothetical protein
MAERGGQIGNNNAGKNKPFWRAIDKAIAQDNGERLRKAAERLLDLAAQGEQWAVKELGDRLDGKPAQAITGADGEPLTITFVRKDENVL